MARGSFHHNGIAATKKAALILSVLLYGCGPGHIYYCNLFEAGMCIRFAEHEHAAGQFDEIVRVVEEESRIYYPKVKNLAKRLDKHGVTVTFTNHNLMSDCHHLSDDTVLCEKNLGGVIINNQEIWVEDIACLARSALAHEILHFVDHSYTKDQPNVSHTFPFFEQADPERRQETIEYRANSRLHCSLPDCNTTFCVDGRQVEVSF